MSNEDYRPGSDNGRRRRRGGRSRDRDRRGDRRSGPGHSSSRSHAPAKKQNPILAFFARLFGGGDSAPSAVRPPRDENRREDGRRESRDRRERGGSNRSDRALREAAEGPISTDVYRGHPDVEHIDEPIENGDEAREPREARAPRERSERPERAGDKEGARPRQTEAEITTPRLYVGNLSYDAADSDLFDLFSQVAPVRNIEIARERESHRSKGFGFVEMETLEAAKLARERLNGYELLTRPLVISGAKGVAERRPAAR